MKDASEPTKDAVLVELRKREGRAIRLIVEALGEAFGFGLVATIARETWAEREPEFEKVNRDIDSKAGGTGKKTVGGTLTTDTEGGLI